MNAIANVLLIIALDTYNTKTPVPDEASIKINFTGPKITARAMKEVMENLDHHIEKVDQPKKM